MTSWPPSASRSAMLQPMNPAPPVTRMGREDEGEVIEFLPCLCRGGGPCVAWWRGLFLPQELAPLAAPPPHFVRSPSSRNRGEEFRSPRSCHEPSCLELGAGLVDAVVGGLDRNPFGEFGEALLKVLARHKAEPFGGLGAVAEAVADVADAALADDLRRDLVLAHRAGEFLRHLGHRAIV